jgi:bifunctional enzyme CysN/CysC
MAQARDVIATENQAGLRQGQGQGQARLRFIVCGSANDGKTTLIDRVVRSSHVQPEEPLAGAVPDAAKWATQGSAIDVACRGFSTGGRSFIVAETPGDARTTRSMVACASTADVAVMLVDARHGVRTQTRRLSVLVQLMGIRQVVLAINQMDRVAFSQDVFDRIDADYRAFAAQLGLAEVTSIPMSALQGDNVIEPSPHTPWYAGPTLMACLETCELDETRMLARPMRLPVQGVQHPTLGLRSCSGRLASGTLRTGDRVRVQPSGRESRVARIVAPGGDLPLAVAGQSVQVTLGDDINIEPGDLISHGADPAEVADQFEASIVWMADEPLLPGRPYALTIGTRTVSATMAEPKYKVNVNTLERLAARRLEQGEIGVCNVALDRTVPFDACTANRATGGFTLLDRTSQQPVAAGMLHFALRRSQNVHWQPVDIDKAARARLMQQTPTLLWFTGLSGAGKSTIANLVAKKLYGMGRHTYLLDGDNVRHGLNKDLGFTAADRVENIRRVAEVGRLMVDAGLIVISAFISPFRAERALARSLLQDGEFIEVFVDVPLALAEQRDVKGLYAKARRGQLPNFTGIDSPYEAPEAPEIHLDTAALSVEQAAEQVLAELQRRGIA